MNELFSRTDVLGVSYDRADEILLIRGEAHMEGAPLRVPFTVAVSRYEAEAALDRGALPLDSPPGEAEAEIEDKLAALIAFARRSLFAGGLLQEEPR